MMRFKRMVAFALAMLIAVPAMGSVTGFATVDLNVISAPSNSWTKGTTVPNFVIEVLDTQELGTGLSNHDLYLNDSAKIKLDAGCDFSAGTLKITEAINTGGLNNAAKYKVAVSGLKHKSSATTANLKFKVEYKNNRPATTVELTVPKFNNSSDGGTTPTPPGGDVESNARYTLQKVSSPANSGNTTIPASTPRYDVNNINASSDASIRQNYFVDLTVKLNLPTGSSGVVLDSIKTNDLGSFVFDSANSSVELYNSGTGYGEIVFTAIRYTGNGKSLAFRIDNGVAYSTDVVVAVSECITRAEAGSGSTNKPNDDDDDGAKIESETPYVIIDKHGYGGGTVTAGETFNLSLTFLNTSDTIDVSNMMITVTMPDDLMLTNSSNTFYVPTLETKKSITKSVQVTAKPAAKAQSHNISVSMKYQYIDHRVATRRSAETTETIAIPVVQVDRFQVTAVEIPMDILVGEETSVTVSFVNKGRSEVYNLAASIDGNITNPGQNQNLGNLASGATGSADFFVTANEAGQLSGTISISYEDTNMEEKIATIPYNATVKTVEEMGGDMGMGGMFPGGSMMPGEGEVVPEETKPTWPIFVGIGVVILIPAAIIGKRFLDKKRKEREDADL